MGCSNSSPNLNPKRDVFLRNNKKKEELTYKVVLLGDVYVGKTSILKNLQKTSEQDESYDPTIGFAFSQKTIPIDNNILVTLQIWDTSGQDIYRDLMSIYYRDSHAAILVFDYSNKDSLSSLNYWIRELDDRINTDDIVIKIAGNKFDLVGEKNNISEEDIQNTFKEFDSTKFEVINTCALSGENVYLLFKKVAQECYNRNQKIINN
jgi:small GTP-binding protein